MESDRFDRIARMLAETDTRRQVLRFGAAFPLASGLAALLDEDGEARRRRARRRRRRNRNDDKGNGNGPGAALPCLPPTADLQEAINDALPNAPITLCAGTWRLEDTIEIGQSLSLIGAGMGKTILDGGGENRVLEIDGGVSVLLRLLTVTNGYTAGEGGGIFNQATLTLIDVAVTGNTAKDGGGGIFNNGVLSLIGDTVVKNNTADDGGGIFQENTQMTVYGGVDVTNNTALSQGGGIFNFGGVVSLREGSLVARNTARAGGGIANTQGTLLAAEGSSVTHNTAAVEGGGLASFGGLVTLPANNIVTGNTLTDGTTVSNCTPKNTIPGCVG